jgi:hypothetical protein
VLAARFASARAVRKVSCAFRNASSVVSSLKDVAVDPGILLLGPPECDNVVEVGVTKQFEKS